MEQLLSIFDALPPPPRYLRTLLLDEEVHFVNNSRCKYLCVGLSPYLNFTPAVVIGGGGRQVLLNKSDWFKLCENQSVIQNYIQSGKSDTSVQSGNINIHFATIGNRQVVKLEDPSEQFITLGSESIDGLFSTKVRISGRLTELELNRFSEFYGRIIKGLKNYSGEDYKTQIVSVLNKLHPDENVCVMHEILEKLYPRVISDIRGWTA